jgi:hypothetical protein
MDQDVKALLEENLRLSKENNELLLKINNVLRWQQITRYLYWVVIIAISLGAMYYIKPYLGNLLNLYTGGVSGSANIGDITNSFKNSQTDMQDLLKSLN